MHSYFSTFITGFDKVVEKALTSLLNDVQIELLADGLVIYKTSANLDEIKSIKFLNNSYVLIKKFENVTENSLHNIFSILIKDNSLVNITRESFPKENLKFRIRASVKNQFVSVDKNLLGNLEDKITHVARNLILDRSLPDIEFLITVRSEGFGLAGIQFSRRPNYEKTLEKGELYPELAHILCLISEPNNNDVFFDPFAGHGSIPAQRLNFSYKRIIAGEIDRDLQRKLEKKFDNKVIVAPVNALSLSTVSDSSIDKIVTDPPWGLYETIKDIPEFYALLLKQCQRVLKENGIMVILTARKELIETLLGTFEGKFKLEEKYGTLVSGKKAGVYKVRKISKEI